MSVDSSRFPHSGSCLRGTSNSREIRRLSPRGVKLPAACPLSGGVGNRAQVFSLRAKQASLPSPQNSQLSFFMAILPPWKDYKPWEGKLQSHEKCSYQRHLRQVFQCYSSFCFSSCSEKCKATLVIFHGV